MKIFTLSIALTLSFILTSTVHAETRATTTEIETLTAHVEAISEFIQRETERAITTPLTDHELRASIEAGVEWIINAQEPNGHFKYEYLPYESMYRVDDNIVRQAGTLYALGEILKHTKTDSLNIAENVERALSYFSSISKPTEGRGLCVANTAKSTKCQLGATSLALIGLLDYLVYAPEDTEAYENLVEGYVTFILAQQKENGGFRNTYHIGKTKQSDAESPFSNGEALLALVRFYEFEKRDAVKQSINDAFIYLKGQPYNTALYLWIMAALKDLQRVEPRDTYVTYAETFTKWRVARGAYYLEGTRNSCAFIEGVASALSVLKNEIPDDTYLQYQNVVDHGSRLNRRLQLTESDTLRLFNSSTGFQFRTLSEPQTAIGGFLTSITEPTQRIDFTQHCVNTSLQMLIDVRGKKLHT